MTTLRRPCLEVAGLHDELIGAVVSLPAGLAARSSGVDPVPAG